MTELQNDALRTRACGLAKSEDFPSITCLRDSNTRTRFNMFATKINTANAKSLYIYIQSSQNLRMLKLCHHNTTLQHLHTMGILEYKSNDSSSFKSNFQLTLLHTQHHLHPSWKYPILYPNIRITHKVSTLTVRPHIHGEPSTSSPWILLSSTTSPSVLHGRHSIRAFSNSLPLKTNPMSSPKKSPQCSSSL